MSSYFYSLHSLSVFEHRDLPGNLYLLIYVSTALFIFRLRYSNKYVVICVPNCVIIAIAGLFSDNNCPVFKFLLSTSYNLASIFWDISFTFKLFVCASSSKFINVFRGVDSDNPNKLWGLISLHYD